MSAFISAARFEHKMDKMKERRNIFLSVTTEHKDQTGM
jgi:hypothetical protein